MAASMLHHGPPRLTARTRRPWTHVRTRQPVTIRDARSGERLVSARGDVDPGVGLRATLTRVLGWPLRVRG